VAANRKTAQLLKAVARVTGDPGRKCKEGKRFRTVVTTADGHTHAVHTQVNNHGRDVKSYQLPQIAAKWCLTLEQLDEALEQWDPDTFRAHFAQFTKDELNARSHRV
jgi:hypothetical protein